MTLLEVRDLTKHFPITKWGRNVGAVRAVDGVSFTVPRGRTVGLVGESGSGKSTTARLVLRLLRPTSGGLRFDGTDLIAKGPRELKPLRRRMQIVFQDPFAALNPRMRIVDAVGEPLEVHGLATGRRKRNRVGELLEHVGLPPGDMDKYPHQFSGGQAQRIGIARALATGPDLIVCDEAVSAVDVSVQAQVLNLLKRLQRELGLAYLFIAHDLNVVRYVSDEICVMYLGEIVERGEAETVFSAPAHPYTEALLAAVPSPDPAKARSHARVIAPGDPPSPRRPPPGCRFHTRCPHAFDRCRTERPVLQEVSPGHHAACHLRDPLGGSPRGREEAS
ncbi:ABC transporter ATP-binding protein [Actinomadura sp. NBRC 104412]|uniref:ABC transporter ATP-binding protein n=1 Tax=Actinomadura sp. NBRC 104412 TaxID=3032203 RepID=UPI0024A305AB|nr:ABC transporter ATP-binding protein [Actinomadura sp. NBRC 104412]GLZ06231.1 ABC transporter ATP-binding protein [Actinomadura sp. NBRC 104412]